jgi:hypothetical protein
MIKRPRSSRIFPLSNDKRAIEITDLFMSASVLVDSRLKWNQIHCNLVPTRVSLA